jgi:hypothetical protein
LENTQLWWTGDIAQPDTRPYSTTSSGRSKGQTASYQGYPAAQVSRGNRPKEREKARQRKMRTLKRKRKGHQNNDHRISGIPHTKKKKRNLSYGNARSKAARKLSWVGGNLKVGRLNIQFIL